MEFCDVNMRWNPVMDFDDGILRCKYAMESGDGILAMEFCDVILRCNYVL